MEARGGNAMRRDCEKMVRPQIVLFGDSIVQDSFGPGGWGAALAHTFSRKADVVVRGYEEYNTRWATFLLNKIFSPNGCTPPCATLIFFGANDSALLGSSSQRLHVPQEEYKDNLSKIVTHLKGLSPSMVVVLVTPLPVDEFGREQHARSLFGDTKKVPDRTNKMTGSYARQCLDLAEKLDLPWIDLWFAMQQISDWQKLFFDRSHLTDQGNAFVHREVVKVLIEAGINAQHMQIDFPHHFEIEEAPTEHHFQQDFYSSQPVDLDYGEDLVAEMLIPSSSEDSKLMSTPLQTTTTFEFDSFLDPLPEGAIFPSPSCLTSSSGPSSSDMAGPTGFKGIEENKCQGNPIIKIKEEPLPCVATSSSILVPTHIKKEHSGLTTPSKELKEDMSMGPTLIPKKVCKGRRKKSYKKSAQPQSWLCNKNKTTVGKTCAHCQTKKTPQWRTGPDGTRSLCNACGVRYRLGRLFPEYRPIDSPTFVPELHSNFHKEVAKMRRVKERQVNWVEC